MAFLDEHGLEYYTSKIKEYIGKQVGQAIGEVTQLRFEVVTELPETGEVGVIYLKSLTGSEANNVYDEFIWVGTNFEFVGTTETDLSNYYNKNEVDDALAGKQNTLTPGTNIILENDTISANLEGYATETWVNDQNYLKEHQSLEGYLTKEVADNTYAPLVETEIVYEGDLQRFK
jgi:hypothetical protein